MLKIILSAMLLFSVSSFAVGDPDHIILKPEDLKWMPAPTGLPAGAMTALPPASFARMKAGMHHYAGADEETIVQLNGTGPWTITYVNPADAPRHTK